MIFFRILEENELNLTNVEKSQLINLLPQKSEEAFALIPSLREKYEYFFILKNFIFQMQ